MTAPRKRIRLFLAVSLAVLWTAWAVWSNRPHRYDADALQKELAEQFPSSPVPTLGPAAGGFPLAHMRYDFSRNNQLKIHELSKDKLGLNILLCTLATFAVVKLAVRTTSLSRPELAIAGCLMFSACIGYILLGRHPLVIACAYFLPLIVWTGSVFGSLFKNDDAQNQATKQTRGASITDN